MRITQYVPALSPCFLMGMLFGLLSYILFTLEYAKFRMIQAASTKPDFDVVQVTSLMLSATITLYFAIGGFWGYTIGRAHRAYTLASQTNMRAGYGTMASEA
jgi:hypothetical protein